MANTDSDSDGQMTAAEMLAAGHDQVSVKTFMEQHDINGDGKLSASEILTLHTHTEAESSFREHDTNKVASQRDSNPRRAGFADRHR